MRHKNLVLVPISLATLVAVLVVGRVARPEPTDVKARNRVFEIRTYTTEPGKLDALHARFRDHTTKLFENHGITSIGYWTPADEPRSQDTLIYIVAHASREAAKKNWEGFVGDPAWQKARDESDAAGPIVKQVVSVFVDPTEYSPIR